MLNTLKKKMISRRRRVFRVRKKLHGTLSKPRLCVSKSNKNIYAQLIDDENGKTIIGLSSLSNKNIEKKLEKAKWLGEQIAKLAKEKDIEKVVFDRGRFKYHGLIAQLADNARKAGLQF